MFTHGRLSILGLALCITGAAATTPTLARHVAAASAAPQMTVVGYVSTYLLHERNPDRDQLVRQMTLRVTGSHFAPGSTVGVAVINTARWEVIATGSTHAQPARTTVLCGHDFRTCYLPNDRAGTVDYRVRLNSAPAASNLQVLYRSGRDGGMQGVTLR